MINFLDASSQKIKEKHIASLIWISSCILGYHVHKEIRKTSVGEESSFVMEAEIAVNVFSIQVLSNQVIAKISSLI